MDHHRFATISAQLADVLGCQHRTVIAALLIAAKHSHLKKYIKEFGVVTMKELATLPLRESNSSS